MIKPEINATTLGVEIKDIGNEKVVKIIVTGSQGDMLVAASHLLISLTSTLSSQGGTREQLTYLRALYEFTADEIHQKKVIGGGGTGEAYNAYPEGAGVCGEGFCQSA